MKTCQIAKRVFLHLPPNTKLVVGDYIKKEYIIEDSNIEHNITVTEIISKRNEPYATYAKVNCIVHN